MSSPSIIRTSTAELYDAHVLKNYARPALTLVRGQGSRVWDDAGNRYLDFTSGIAVSALGHCHPHWVAAVQRQAAELIHVSNLFRNPNQGELARRIVKYAGPGRVFFCNSGAEANEGAFKFARRYARAQGYPDKFEILAFSGAFHGRTFGALAATPRPKYQEPFTPLMPGVRFATFNDLESARAQMDERVCAIIVEPIQGEGGIYPASEEFLRGLRQLADAYDALLIYDEIQCGVGRTGSFWAYQGLSQDGEPNALAPDILTAAKPLAGGMPMGAILMRQKVAEAMHKGEHGSTFAGGPLVTSVAQHVVGRVRQPAFLAEVEAKGNLLREMLEELNSPHIVAVRGKGLMVGVELDIDAAPVISQAFTRGLLLVNAGPNVLRLVPPLIISEAEIAFAVETVGEILQEI